MPLLHKICRYLCALLFFGLINKTSDGQDLLYLGSHNINDQSHKLNDLADTGYTLLFNGFEYIPTITATNASPFFPEDSGSVGTIMYYSTTFSQIPFRYDIENDQVLFLPDRPPYRLVLVTEAVQEFQIGSHHFIQQQGLDSSLGAGFLELLADGPQMLLARHTKVPEERIRDLQVKRSYKLNTAFYLLRNKKLAAIPNAKGLIRAFPDAERQLNSFAKREGIPNKSVDPLQLAQLIRFYESLQQQ